jgi:hypothetical protein
MMSCVHSIEGRQTEFEFYCQLVASPDSETCCGPVTHVVFDRTSMQSMFILFGAMNKNEGYLDRFDPQVLDSRNLRLTMCARHWLQHADILHKFSHTYHRHDWEEIAFYINKATHLLNAWDEKELSNYLR